MASKRTPPTSAVSRAEKKPAPSRSRGRTRDEGASFPVPPPAAQIPDDYFAVRGELKQHIAAARPAVRIPTAKPPGLCRKARYLSAGLFRPQDALEREQNAV